MSWYLFASSGDDKMLERMIMSNEEEKVYHPLDPKHPLHQDVIDRPERYVAVPKDLWNQLIERAAAARNLESRISNMFWKWFPTHTFVSFDQALSIFERDLRPQEDEEWKESFKTGETWYPCRHPGCKAQYKNSSSNRTRHEKQAHGYTHKENGHES